MSIFFVFLLATLLITGVFGLAVQRRWYEYMRTKHPKAWTALGEPRLLGSSAAVQWRVLRFVQAGNYRDLQDANLDTLTRSLRRWGIFYIALFALTVGVFLTFLFAR